MKLIIVIISITILTASCDTFALRKKGACYTSSKHRRVYQILGWKGEKLKLIGIDKNVVFLSDNNSWREVTCPIEFL